MKDSTLYLQKAQKSTKAGEISWPKLMILYTKSPRPSFSIVEIVSHTLPSQNDAPKYLHDIFLVKYRTQTAI